MRRRGFLAGSGFAVAAPSVARAQAYPDRPVRIVVGAPPGGGLDVLVRGVAQELSARWGKPVVVDNKSGASGVIAAEGVAAAAADGYTLLATTDQTFLGNRFAFRTLPYDPDRSFANVTIMARADQFMLAHPAVAASTLPELVALGKAATPPAYGSWGEGSPPHLLYETLNRTAGTRLLHVPYKGVAPVLAALSSGEVQLSVASSGVAGALLRSQKLKALAIAAGQRSALFPDVPTTTELGFPQLQAFIWFGLAAPAGTPADLVGGLSESVRAILGQPAFAEKFIAAIGWKPVASTPAETDRIIRDELPIIRAMSAAAGIKPQ
ncbi:MAG: tripartite tricarboxylate transporter substrate-binding protein [Reyranellaceae bacterium]